MDPEVHKASTGVQVRPILNNLQRLLSAGARVRVRVPLIPGISDGDNIDRTGRFLKDLPGIEGVQLLPYHRPAQEKHQKFDIPWLLPDDLAMPAEHVQVIASRMESYGLSVTVGG